MRRALLLLSAVLLALVAVNSLRLPSVSRARLASDIFQEIDRRLEAAPPPDCPALYTAASVPEIKGACPAFQPWSDEAVRHYAQLVRRHRRE